MHTNMATPSSTPITRRHLYRATAVTPTPSSKSVKYTVPVPTPSSSSISRGGPSGDLPPSVLFDDIMRHYDNFINYASEIEFLEFINLQEDCRKKWYNSEQEVLRLKVEIENYQTEQQRHEKQMTDFRRQFESKLEVVSRLESEIETRRSRINSGINLSRTYLNDTRISVETKDKIGNILAALEGVDMKRSKNQVQSPGGLDTISEADTTDLSMTHSEDDLDYSIRRRTRGQSKRRSNEHHLDHDFRKKKIRTSNGARQIVDSSGNMDQVVSKTIVSIPRSGGPIHATSTLETLPSGFGDENNVITHIVQPSAPPMTGTSESESDQANLAYIMKPPRYPTRSSVSKKEKEIIESPRFGRTLSATSGNMKNHSWVTKTVMAPETCGQCYKKIHFAKIAYKCKSCKAACHPDCKDKVPLPCVAASTPSKSSKGQIGIIADYTPNTHPMVPALIQHCVNEIELRGLTHEGLYRVRGLEREIKELKDRFLRGKGTPNLAIYDPHVICGCIKDFLRSLREPLVGRHFWRDFALATDISDPKKRQVEIHRALEELPPPNQDTLAFIVLHLQRVAEIEEVKMPLTNMAKVFGPTLIGYSSFDLDANSILQETKKQQLILSTLLNMSPDYWTKFIKRGDAISLSEMINVPNTRQRTSRFSSVGRARGGAVTNATAQVQAPVQATPVNNKQSSKKIYFHDDSPQRTNQSSNRPKRNYFE